MLRFVLVAALISLGVAACGESRLERGASGAGIGAAASLTASASCPWLFLGGVCQAPEVAGFAPGVAPRITLDASAALPPLPSAVEVALYRITHEALTNASSMLGRIRAG